MNEGDMKWRDRMGMLCIYRGGREEKKIWCCASKPLERREEVETQGAGAL
jgi:hypothetical protein